MAPFYYCRSEQYSKMARQFYVDFLSTKAFYQSGKYVVKEDAFEENLLASINLSQKIDDSYIGAVVFEAMAIESYVNLMGAYLTDERTYYRETERYSTKEKLSYIFMKNNSAFPADLQERIGALFARRNKLVHQKPKAVVIDIQNSDTMSLGRGQQSDKFYRRLHHLQANFDSRTSRYFPVLHQLNQSYS